MSHNASSMAYIIIGNQNLTSAPTQHSLQLLVGDNKGGQMVGCVPAVPMRPTIGPTFTSLQNKFHPNLCATRTYQGGVNHNVMSSMLSAHQKETVIEITKIPIEDCLKDSKVATLHAADTGVQHSLQEAAKRIKLEYRPKGTANVGTIAQMVNQQSFCHTPSDSSIVNAVNAHIQQPPTSRGYHIVLPPSGENKRYTVLSTEGLQPQATTGSGSTEKMDSSGQLDTSLTNIQWLGSMTGDTLVRNNNQVDHRVYVSEQQIEKVSRECGRSRRPPFSYMTMIQMAINSKPDKRMTLREIYGWVETKFPYYKYTAKQGWKNSIRHNLSLYELFVRERVSTPGLVGSYWTLKKESACKKATPRRSSGCVIAPKGGLPVVNAVSSVTQGLQEGSSNDWALVSLQGLQMLQSPCAEKIIPSSLRRPSDSRTSTGTKKQVKIAPRVSVCDGSQLITQAWLNASLGTSNLSDLLSLSGLTTGLNLTGTDSPGRDSGIDSQMSEKSSSDTSLAQSIPQKIEKKGRKRKRKATNTVRRDSCEYKPNPSALTNVSLSDSFLAGLENEFSSPIRQLLQTPPKFSDSRATSTPYRNKNASPEFCSPLRGFSPLRSLQDNNILTSPGRDTSLGLIPLTPENQRTPRAGSLSELGLHGFTPLAHGRNSSLGNHSFSRLFADIPLDGIDENSSIDIANLSWPDVPIL